MTKILAVIIGGLALVAACSDKDEASLDTRPAVVPTFGREVPPGAERVVGEFLAAFHRADGQVAVRHLHVERGRDELATALANAPVPILNPVVTAGPGEQLTVRYEIPDLGSILAAVLDGGRNTEMVRAKLQALTSSPVRDARVDTWRLVGGTDGLKIDYGNRGIVRYAELLGGDIQLYATDDGWRRMSDRVPLQGALPERVPRLMSDYYRSFGIELLSADPRPVFAKLEPVLQQMLVRDRPSLDELIQCIKERRPGAGECAQDLAGLGDASIQPVVQALLAVPSVELWTPYDLSESAGTVIGMLSAKSDLAVRTVDELVRVLECATVAQCESVIVAGSTVRVVPGDIVSPVGVMVSRTLGRISEEASGRQALRSHLETLERIQRWSEQMPLFLVRDPEGLYFRDRIRRVVERVRG